ncbi:hypothetical protein B296_00021959 [Ensete ventricosum]|uniref:Uncharacterized protein n=1 Tax=Ensete ventricosum TaxID=4639 RepID=A0A426ZHZ3_ENSVE|nr:hypothetical protein B296_00021959 [Ensete ventricosum]
MTPLDLDGIGDLIHWTYVKTLAHSKLGGDLYRGSASLKLYRGSLLQSAA